MDEALTRIMDMLGNLADKLGQTADQLWPEVVRYVAIQGLIYSALAMLLIVVIWSAAFKLMWTQTRFLNTTIDCKLKNGCTASDAEKTAIKNTNEAVTAIRYIATIFASLATWGCLVMLAKNLPRVFAPVGHIVFKILGTQS